jgi:hypothetical protein
MKFWLSPEPPMPLRRFCALFSFFFCSFAIAGIADAQAETRECLVVAQTKVLSSPGGSVLGQLSNGTYLYKNKEAQVSGSKWSYVLEKSIEGWVRDEDLECTLAKWWYGTDEKEGQRDVMPGPGKSIAIAFCHIEGDPIVGIGNSPTETLSTAMTKCIAATPTRAKCCKVVVVGDREHPCVAITIGEHASYGVGNGKTAAAAQKKSVDELGQFRTEADVAQCLPAPSSDPLGGGGWHHNDSNMTLRVFRDTIEIFYDIPNTDMAKAGAKPGDLLFTGKRHGQNISGTALLFNNHCGKVSYDVAGRIESSSHITMHGMAPKRDDRCQARYHDDPLEFTR